jgi:hypothetical protein
MFSIPIPMRAFPGMDKALKPGTKKYVYETHHIEGLGG